MTVAVTDEEILNAKAVIDQSGIGCEPASAATVAGLKKLVDNQTIDKEEQALCILTGNMLKDTDVLKKYHTEQHVFSNPIVKTLLTKEEIATEL